MMTQIDIPSTSTIVSGARFQGAERREASASNALSVTPNNPQKLPLHVLLEKAEQYAQLVNGSSRFRKSPGYIRGELRDYQVQALNWLISLYENRIGGILADEMGLGKTIQSIAILGYLKFFKNIDGPFLVIGTKSVISSWMDEFKKFCPAMKVIEVSGDKQTRVTIISQMQTKGLKWDVCVTTFETILSDAFFRHQHWHYVVIDEAHRLKNEKTVFGKLVREMPSKHRLLLTGTPLQNNLHELWALLNYLMPDIFSDSKTFDAPDEQTMKSIKSILQPFFLRRIKADVEGSLLPKIESNLFVGLTKLQRDTYIKTIDKHSLRSQSEKLQDMRKIANHPYLIHGVEPGPPYQDHGDHLITTSGKMMALDELLKHLKLNGSRVLVFSQFVDMLDILEDYLDWRKYQYRRLDGQTSYSQRANDIEEFNAANSQIFIYILSTHAGSLGINLQTADTVIIFDSDWNPLTDLQAIDRVHRIGQKKQVRVYRLVTEDTVDECIVQRAEVKLRLNNLMIDQGRVCENSQVPSRIKNNALDFGVAAISASDKAVITDVDLNALLRYSQQKTIERTTKLKSLNEAQLRSIGHEEASVVPRPHQLNSIYVNCRHSDVRSTNNIQTVPATVPPPVASDSNNRITNRVNESPQQTTKEAAPVLNNLIRVAQFACESPSASPVNSRPLANILKVLTATPTVTNIRLVRLNVYQFYPVQLIKMCDNRRMLNMSTDTSSKETLLAQGFHDWTEDDYKVFCDAVLKYGRFDLTSVADMLRSKKIEDVAKYHEVFFRRGPSEVAQINEILGNIKLEEMKHQQRNEAIKWKMSQFGRAEFQVVVNGMRSEKFTSDHDKYLVCAISRYGLSFNVCDRIIADIRFHSDFGLFSNLRFGTISDQEIKDRINQLVASIEDEFLTSFIEIIEENDQHPLGDNNAKKRKLH